MTSRTRKRITSGFFPLREISQEDRIHEEATIMKGPKPASLKEEMKRWAKHMRYHWAENTDPSVPFDGFLYRGAMLIAAKMKKLRHGLEDNCIIENKLPDDVADLRNLPVPRTSSASSGCGRRTSGRTAGSISFRTKYSRSRRIPQKITGTRTTGKLTGRRHRTGSRFPAAGRGARRAYIRKARKTLLLANGRRSLFLKENLCPRRYKFRI